MTKGRPILNIAGQRFGKLTAVGIAGRNDHNQILWYCKCDCGGSHTATLATLRSGGVKRCPDCRSIKQENCPHCGSSSLKSGGYRFSRADHSKGKRRFRCLSCLKYFSESNKAACDKSAIAYMTEQLEAPSKDSRLLV
jgi:rRNA maturation protein Nop10